MGEFGGPYFGQRMGLPFPIPGHNKNNTVFGLRGEPNTIYKHERIM